MAKDLRIAIYDALYVWGDYDKLPPGEGRDEVIVKTKKCANDIGDAIKEYMIENTWSITSMQANVQLDHIKTTDAIPVNIEPDTLMAPYSPMMKVIKSLGFDLFSVVRKQVNQVVESGAFTHQLKLHKMNLFQQGGRLDAKGKAFVGPNDNTGYDIGAQIKDKWLNRSTVQLNPSKMKLDKDVK